MPSKQENYLIFDHRACGPTMGQPAVVELATKSCGHCQRQVIMNPGRVRYRPYCRKCDKYICDECEVVRVASGYACRPFKQVIDEYLERTTKGALIHG